MRDEGVTKYECLFEAGDAPDGAAVAELIACRQRLFSQGLIGVYADGIGYGNVSVRLMGTQRFLITGTQTGSKTVLTAEDFCEVFAYDIARNRVSCRGRIAASSESMTHAAVYELNPQIGAIIHIHSSRLWHSGLQTLPTTAAAVAYGTPAMAGEMLRLYQTSTLAREQILIMAGHDEGVITFGKTLHDAESVLQKAIVQLPPGSGKDELTIAVPDNFRA